MYAYIRGRLDGKQSDCVVVEAAGVGYRVYTSMSTLSRLPAADTEIKLYTHFSVREDAHILYGFLTKEELGMFEIMLTVSGVGPKAALAMLSAVSPSQFGLAVLTEDVKLLTRAQGVGSKLAQKIVFELRDKLAKDQAAGGSGGAFAGFGAGAAADAGAAGELAERGKFAEAVGALLILGYSASEANHAVEAIYSDELEIEEIIRRALRGH